jgi:hypothetical protein
MGFLQKQTNADTEYIFDTAMNEHIDDIEMLYGGHSAAYIVGTRVVGIPEAVKGTWYRDDAGRVARMYPRTDVNTPIPEGLVYDGRTRAFKDSVVLFYIPDLNGKTAQRVEIEPPYEAEGNSGIWSVVDLAESGDAYVDAEGKLHVYYTTYHFDFDDNDRRENPQLVADTLQRIHAVYEGATLVFSEILDMPGMTKDTAIRMTQTADGTVYLLACNLGEEGARIDAYCRTETGWALCAAQPIGDFTAEAFNITSPRGGSVQDDTVDCLIYATDNDVYHVAVTFAK